MTMHSPVGMVCSLYLFRLAKGERVFFRSTSYLGSEHGDSFLSWNGQNNSCTTLSRVGQHWSIFISKWSKQLLHPFIVSGPTLILLEMDQGVMKDSGYYEWKLLVVQLSRDMMLWCYVEHLCNQSSFVFPYIHNKTSSRYLAQTHQMKEKLFLNSRNALRHTSFPQPHQMTYDASGNP
jgi:hypothetical protein